jgi:hypothetical protein
MNEYILIPKNKLAAIESINATQTGRTLQPVALADGRMVIPAGCRTMALQGRYWSDYAEVLEPLKTIEVGEDDWPVVEEDEL